jgi:DNA-binding MarR family transcriptional regulator
MGYFDSIYADNLLPHRAKTVYIYLKSRAAHKGECWPGIKTIAKDLGLSRSTVKRAIADLEKHGYIEKKARYRENGSYTSNLYRVKE